MNTHTNDKATWADSYGNWYVRVSKTAVAPLLAARRALRDELLARDSHCAREVWMHPVHMPDMDTDTTIVYRENFINSGYSYDVLDFNGDILYSSDSWNLAITYLAQWETAESKGSVRDNETGSLTYRG